MEWFSYVDWERILLPQTPLLEIFVRGSVVYLSLFLFLRFALKRESGTVGITDLLVIVLVADAAQNAMADDYRAIPDGLLLVATIIFWAYALNWLGYRFPAVQRIIHPPALQLVRKGELVRQNMRKEFITEEELRGMLREQGVEDISQVERAYLEGNGRLSVISSESSQHKGPEKRVL